jgi:antitoxin component YwqK of YwqJK toxin-antitoxin module
MVRQANKLHMPLVLGLVLSICVLGQVSAEDIDEFAMVPRLDEEVTLEEADGTAGIADLERPVEIIQERYAGGELKIRREVTQDEQENYILHGSWKMWDEQGNVVGSGEFRNNHREGPWTRIHTGKDAALFAESPYKEFTAPFTSTANFKNGQLEGKWVISDAEGRIASEWEFADGVRHGMSKWNYVSGKLAKEIGFQEGLIDGHVRVYDAESNLVDEQKFEQGHKIAMKVDYDEKRRKSWEAMYMHAQLVIDQDVDWWNAKPAVFKAVGEDVKHGLATGWYQNGQMRVQGVYDKDQPDGKFTWWYANGQEEVTGGFKDGLKDGLWVWRHPNGQKSMLGHSELGAATGVWYKWRQDGQLIEKTDFSAITEDVPSLAAEEDDLNDTLGEMPVETSQTPMNELFSR